MRKTMNKNLSKLIDRCNGSVSITFNQHRDYYEPLEVYFTGKEDEVEPDVLVEIIKRQTLVSIHLYPDSPVGYYEVHHYDLEKALEIALDAIK
jgi:hypothetical protein